MFEIGKKGSKKLVYFSETTTKNLENIRKAATESNQPNCEKFWQYHDLIFNGLQIHGGLTEDNWKKLTQAQKVMLTLGHFISQSDNGGVWQFLFNKPEFSFAALDAMNIAKPFSLFSFQYEKVLREFVLMFENKTWDNLLDNYEQAEEFEEQWKIFKSGQEHIPSHQNFEKEFYDPENKERFYGDLIIYIEQHISMLLKVEIAASGLNAEMKKKDAVPYFTKFIEEKTGQKPVQASVYYSAKVSFVNQSALLYLIEYIMPNGYHSIGITGVFTLFLDEMPMTEIQKMYKKYHKQELINMFHGYYLVKKTLEENPDANKCPENQWQTFLNNIQNPEKSQIPVNVKFLDYIKFEGIGYFFYTGDLLYHDKSKTLHVENVEMDSVSSKITSEYQGEPNKIFMGSTKNMNDFGGRKSATEPITAKYVVYDTIGSRKKLLKDNPWAF